MQPKTLKFRASGMALVQDYEALEGGVRKYVGRKAVPLEDGTGRLSWPPLDEPAEVPYRADYVAACRVGDLEAADEETAEACGVHFGIEAEADGSTTQLMGDGAGEALPEASPELYGEASNELAEVGDALARTRKTKGT